MSQLSKQQDIFASMLLRAIDRIAYLQNKKRELVREQLARAIERNSSTVDYWIYRKHLPARREDLENLVSHIARLDGWKDAEECLQFLLNANHPAPGAFLQKIFPKKSSPGPILLHEEQEAIPGLAAFVVGLPIQFPVQFFGRERELRRIFSALQGPYLQNVAVSGAQRSGKTSLLHYLRKITRTNRGHLRPDQNQAWLLRPHNYHWIFVDFQDARTHTQESLFRYLLSRMGIPLPPSACSLADFIDLVSGNIQEPTILLLDEIQVALEMDEFDQEFWWGLRALAANLTDGKLAFIIASQKAPSEMLYEPQRPSPFFNIFSQHIALGPLTEEEARQLVSSSPIPFDPQVMEWILQTSHHWPALMQILCQVHLTALQEGSAESEDWREEGLKRIAPFNHLLEMA